MCKEQGLRLTAKLSVRMVWRAKIAVLKMWDYSKSLPK